MGSAVSSRVDHWRNLHSATFDACSVGVEADGKQAKKPWCFVSSSERLIPKRTRYYGSIFIPHAVNQHVCSMPCVARCQQPRHVKCRLHRLLDRSEWKDRPEVLDAINSKKQGLLANGAWDESKAKVLAEA